MAAGKKLRICLVSSEVAPLAKTGGLADVSMALATYLHRAGHDVRVLMPCYDTIDAKSLIIVPVDFLQNIPISIGSRHGKYSIDTAILPGSDTPIYLLRCPDLYNRGKIYTNDADEHRRFILLSRAAIEMCQRMAFSPDIFSCHDWHTALIPLYLKTVYQWDRIFARTKTVLTIHNIGYQGIFSGDIIDDIGLHGAEGQLHQQDLGQGRINFLKTGVLHADQLTTVSPTHAQEILSDEYGMGLQDLLKARRSSLAGILNGVDDAEWNPATDPLIPKNFSAGSMAGKRVCKLALMDDLKLSGGAARPLVGIVTRLTGQKGIDLMEASLPRLLTERDFNIAVLGSGEPRYERFFESLQRAARDRVCFYRGYSNKLAHWIEAGSDFFLMPSLYEPCGLNQMYSLMYGTVPIVRQTGGLADAVQMVDPAKGSGTGIVFRDYNLAAFNWAMNAALDLFGNRPLMKKIISNGMSQDFSWNRQVNVYVNLFRALSKES